MRSLSDIMKTR